MTAERFECKVCGYIYDPQDGVPEFGIAAGMPFAALEESFACPICGVGKENFVPVSVPVGERLLKPIVLTTTVSEIIPRTATITSYRFAAPQSAVFSAGQYLLLSLGAGEESTKCLSISNSPTENGYLEVTKRLTESVFSQQLRTLRQGSEVSITFPLGTFVFGGEEKVALLSGGIGITPLRSICRYIADTQPDADVCLLYSNRSPDEIAFAADFAAMQAACPGLKVSYTVSRGGTKWPGRWGRIDSSMIREAMPDYRDRCFYLCGPENMVTSLCALLAGELGLAAAQIKFENFTGYGQPAKDGLS